MPFRPELIAGRVPQKKTPEQIEDEKKTQENKDLFDDAIGGDFTRIHEGIKFPIDVPGVIDVTVTTPESKTQAQVNVFYRGKDGKERGETLTITASGDLIGRMPKELAALNRLDFYRGVLTGLSAFTSDFWIETEMDVIPPGSWPTGVGAGGPSTRQRVEAGMDPRRMKFLQHQPDALFGHITEKAGFKDYRLVFFPDFIILEHPKEENAAYFIDLPEPIDFTSKNLSKADREAIVKKYWHPDLQVTKWQMVQQGNKRIVHIGDWSNRLQEEIDKHRRHKSGPTPPLP